MCQVYVCTVPTVRVKNTNSTCFYAFLYLFPILFAVYLLTILIDFFKKEKGCEVVNLKQ